MNLKTFAGNPEFPIWLIGDSPPEAWADKLDTPLDPRHPAIHNIWTSVADPMQDRLFRLAGRRLDTSKLYIINARSQPLTASNIEEQQNRSRTVLAEIINEYEPTIILTFGAQAFLLVRLSISKPLEHPDSTTKFLGEEFRKSIYEYSPQKTNILPLLHVSIARGHFLSGHRDFVGAFGGMPPNYFDYVGEKLADLLLNKLSDNPIWIVRPSL